MSEAPDESFLARWARRKREAAGRADDQPAEPALTAAAAAIDPAAGAGRDGVEPPAESAPLPSLDDLRPDGDLTAFLDARVPDELRRLAMRRMWTLDPAIRDFVEIAENQYDWNVPGGAPGWGELDPGTSIEELLAQATGAARPPAAPPEAGEPQSTQSEVATRSGGPVEAGAPEPVVVESGAAALEPVDEGAPFVTAEDASPRRRRHGGALPI